MPNWQLAPRIRSHIKDRAMYHALRMVNIARFDFPLTVAQVQYHLVDLTSEQVTTMRRLDAEGVRTIERHRDIRVAFLRENFPELRRAIVLNLRLPEWVMVGRGTSFGVSTTKFDVHENHYLVPNPAGLDPEDRKKLTSWLDRYLRQVRLFEIVENTLSDLLVSDEGIIPSAAHLRAFWPLLCTLVEPDDANPYMREFLRKWAERFQHPTKFAKPYQPDPDLKKKYAPLILAAESQIVGGRMLPAVSFDHRQHIVPVIEHWERIAGDITFPLA